MKAVLYKSLTNKQDEIELKENTPLYMQLPDVDFENAIIIVNGSERNKDYCPKKNDIIMIRQTPSDPVTIVIGVVAVVSLGVGVYGGVKAYQANKQAEQAMAESERAMENAKKASANPSIDNRPFIAGATNTVATGQGQPYVMGRHLFTPYLLQKGFYKLDGVDGKDQYYYMAFECGFNKQVINSVNVDEVRVKTFTGQTPQDGVFDLDSGIFEDGGRLEIRQGGQFQELTDLNKKIVAQSYNSEIPKRTEENQEYNEIVLDRHAKDVEIGVTYPYGLYAYNDNNDKVARISHVLAQLSFDGGNTWTAPHTIVNTGERNELKELRFSNTIPFTSAQMTQSKNNSTSPIVRLYDNQTESEKARDKVFLLFAQSVCYDPNSPTFEDCKIINQKELELSTVMALKIKSSQANEDKLNKINIITQSIAKTWNGSQWSEAKTPTRNPASIAIEVLTSTAHEQSRYDLDEIDSESFGEWYEYCVLNNYHFDYILNQKVSKEQLIDRILKAGDASLYFDIYGKLAVAIDTFKPNAIACFNAQNIIEIENKKSFTRAIDGVRVNYTTSANDAFTEESVLVMRDGKEYNADSVLQEIKLEGVTEYNHVVKYIRRLIATLNLRPKTTLISVGQEGVYYTPYSKILLQDDSLKIGLSSGVISKIFVQGDKIAYIETNDLVQFEVGKQYGIIVNHLLEDRAIPVAIRVAGTGRTGEIEILDDLTQGDIEAGEVFSFGELNDNGEFDRITSPFLITAVSRVGNKFKIDLVDYNEAVYETGEIPAYESNITEPYKPTPAPIPPDYVTRPELNDAVQQGGSQPIGVPDTPSITAVAGEDRITLKCDPFLDEMRNNIRVITWQVNKAYDAQTPDTGWEDVREGTEFETSYLFNRTEDGYPEKADFTDWRIKCVATSIYGKSSTSAEIAINTDSYGTWLFTDYEPSVTKTERDRTITIRVGYGLANTQIYGTLRSKIEIKKGDEDWQTPNLLANPLPTEDSPNVDNYKGGNEDVIIAEQFVQVLPLEGQKLVTDGGDPPDIKDTTYQYRVTVFNEVHTATPVVISATAFCTSIQDLVYANLDYKNAYVGSLASIINVLGHVSGSAMGGGNNFLSLSSFIQDGVQYYEGDVRLGGDNEYFMIEPLFDPPRSEDNPHPPISTMTGQYKISLKGSNIVIDGGETSFDEFLEVFSTDRTKKTRIESDSIKFVETNGDITTSRNVAILTEDDNFEIKKGYTEFEPLPNSPRYIKAQILMDNKLYCGGTSIFYFNKDSETFSTPIDLPEGIDQIFSMVAVANKIYCYALDYTNSSTSFVVFDTTTELFDKYPHNSPFDDTNSVDFFSQTVVGNKIYYSAINEHSYIADTTEPLTGDFFSVIPVLYSVTKMAVVGDILFCFCLTGDVVNYLKTFNTVNDTTELSISLNFKVKSLIAIETNLYMGTSLNTLEIFDTTTMEFTHSILTPFEMTELTVVGKRIFCSNKTKKIAVFDTISNAFLDILLSPINVNCPVSSDNTIFYGDTTTFSYEKLTISQEKTTLVAENDITFTVKNEYGEVAKQTTVGGNLFTIPIGRPPDPIPVGAMWLE